MEKKRSRATGRSEVANNIAPSVTAYPRQVEEAVILDKMMAWRKPRRSATNRLGAARDSIIYQVIGSIEGMQAIQAEMSEACVCDENSAVDRNDHLEPDQLSE